MTMQRGGQIGERCFDGTRDRGRAVQPTVDADSLSVQTSTLNDQRLLPDAPRNRSQKRAMLTLLVAESGRGRALPRSRGGLQPAGPAPLPVPSAHTFFD
jgi:hypothetical protein